MCFWCLFLDPHLITNHWNIVVSSREVTESGPFYLLSSPVKLSKGIPCQNSETSILWNQSKDHFCKHNGEGIPYNFWCKFTCHRRSFLVKLETMWMRDGFGSLNFSPLTLYDCAHCRKLLSKGVEPGMLNQTQMTIQRYFAWLVLNGVFDSWKSSWRVMSSQ